MQLRSSMLRLQLLWFLSLLLMCILIVQPPCISARPRARARAAARTHAADINLARAAVAATTTNITTTTTTTTTTTRTTTTTNTKSNNKILIILLDGFRWDYFDRPGLTGYQNFLRKGSRAEYLKNSFPTISYPNYYTIMTGLYSNKHGFIGNTMYDPKHDTNFMGTGSYAQYAPYWWDDGDPLWITAKRQNKTSYFYHWPGCEVTIKNLEPDFCRRYTGLPSMNDFKDSIRQGLNNLVNNSADLVGIYFELTDKVGHNYGPNSPEIDQILKTSSKIIDDLLIQIEKLHLEDSVNVVLTSDHGMSEITSDRIISLTYVVDRSDLYYIYGRTFVAFWPVEGKLDKVYKALKNYHPNFTVYLKKDIPERWHLKEHYRVPPLIGVADPGWYVLHPHDIFPGFRGYHGYDNDDADMRGVFAGIGPDFRSNHEVPWFNAVDIYGYLCDILHITPAPNQGDSSITSLMKPAADPLEPIQTRNPSIFSASSSSLSSSSAATATTTTTTPKSSSSLSSITTTTTIPESTTSRMTTTKATTTATTTASATPASATPASATPAATITTNGTTEIEVAAAESAVAISKSDMNSSAPAPLLQVWCYYLILVMAVLSVYLLLRHN